MTRRSARTCSIWAASLAAVMPVAALSQTGLPATTTPSGQFQPPQEPMLLTRTLRRPLPGGKEVMTRRSYEVRILPEGEGFLIDGKLVDVEVEAPENLAALAEMERNRPDIGMFPMHLDSNGMLLPGGDPQSGEVARQAIEMVSRELGAMKLAAFDMLQAQAFVSQFRKRPGHSQWPPDLFRPAPGHQRETRTIPLPNGARGNVTVDTEATTAGPAGMLSSFTRTVTTDLDGDARATYERWTLVDAR